MEGLIVVPGAGRRTVATLALLAVAALALPGCAPRKEAPPKPLATEEVGGGIDSAADLTTDVVGPRPVQGLSGVLPTDFPRDLPLVTPSSLVDFGQDGEGRFILVLVGARAAAVRERQLALARDAGWSVRGAGDDVAAAKGTATVRMRFDAQASATEIRFDY